MERDPFGQNRVYYRPLGAAGRAMKPLCNAGAVGLDPVGTAFAFGELDDTDRTWIEGIRRVPRGHRLSGSEGAWRIEAVAPTPPTGSRGLEHRLLAALDSVVGRGRRAAVALDGGLDSALLLTLLASSFRS